MDRYAHAKIIGMSLASAVGYWFVNRLDGGVRSACADVPSYDTLRLLAMIGAGTPLVAAWITTVEYFQRRSKPS